MVKGDNGNPVDLAVQCLERRRQHFAVEDIDLGNGDLDALAGECSEVARTRSSSACMKAL